MAALLLKLLDHLQLVAGNVLFVEQVDVLDAAIVKHKVQHIVVMHLACLVHDAFAGLIQPITHKALPLPIRKLHVVQRLQSYTHISQQLLWRVDAGHKLIALVDQVLNQLTLQRIFGLVALCRLPLWGVLVENNKVSGFRNGLVIAHRYSVSETRWQAAHANHSGLRRYSKG